VSFAYGKTQSSFPAKPEKGKPHQEQSQICAGKMVFNHFIAGCPPVKRG